MAKPAGMEITFVPLISGTQTGPLGVIHLPRLWLKMRAYNRGLLPEGYRHGNGGSDEGLLTALGVDRDAFAGFIAAGAPDYPGLRGLDPRQRRRHVGRNDSRVQRATRATSSCRNRG